MSRFRTPLTNLQTQWFRPWCFLSLLLLFIDKPLSSKLQYFECKSIGQSCRCDLLINWLENDWNVTRFKKSSSLFKYSLNFSFHQNVFFQMSNERKFIKNSFSSSSSFFLSRAYQQKVFRIFLNPWKLHEGVNTNNLCFVLNMFLSVRVTLGSTIFSIFLRQKSKKKVQVLIDFSSFCQ